MNGQGGERHRRSTHAMAESLRIAVAIAGVRTGGQFRRARKSTHAAACLPEAVSAHIVAVTIHILDNRSYVGV